MKCDSALTWLLAWCQIGTAFFPENSCSCSILGYHISTILHMTAQLLCHFRIIVVYVDKGKSNFYRIRITMEKRWWHGIWPTNPWWQLTMHDDVIKWKHFPHYWPFMQGIHRSPVNSPHKGQWRGALMFSLICVWINNWVNNGEAGDLRCYRAHYDVTVMGKNISNYC